MAKKKAQKNLSEGKPAEAAERIVQPKGNPQPKVNPYAAVKTVPTEKWWVIPLLALVFFIAHLFTSISTIKPLVLILIALAAISCFIRGEQLKSRLSWPVIAVFAWVLMNWISTLYATSGKFALREFLKLMAGFCVFLLVLAWSKSGEHRGRGPATMLEGAAALGSLVSIDMISTHWISGPFYKFLALFMEDFGEQSTMSVQEGTRIYTYTNPNVFAAITGITILLSLELAITEGNKKKRWFHLTCLFLNSLAFLLAFSMGASGAIAVGFLVFLFIEHRERKGKLLILMVETLLLVVAAAFPIFRTSFDTWDGFQPLPLLCAVGGAVLLCLADRFVGKPLSARLEGRSKVITAAIAAVLALLVIYGVLAVNITGPISLVQNEELLRADYPVPGDYTLSIESTGAVNVRIASRNQSETIMNTYNWLYTGSADGASYTVPDDSLIVMYFFRASEDLSLSSATYTNSNGTNTNIKLGYKLLPGFIANRLQGLFDNRNATQRTVYFADGVKLFQKSPIIGLGLGAFESAICSVQSYHYETKYAHNHYIETLLSTGVIGILFFVGMLGCFAVVLIKSRKKEDGNPLVTALLAALVFIAIHAAVEIDFSASFYLFYVMVAFAVICLVGGEELACPEKEAIRTGIVISMAVLSLLFAVTLVLNMRARDIATGKSGGEQYANLELADKMDLYEWADYELSYVYLATDIDQVNEAKTFAKANQYAAKLTKVDSNSIPPYLARYYFSTDQRELAYRALEKYVDYVTSDNDAWQTTFNLLMAYSDSSEVHKAEIARLYEQFQSWNEEHLGTLELSETNQSYISLMLSE